MASYKEMVYNDAVKYIENNIQAIRNDESNRSLHDVLQLNPEVTGFVEEDTPYCNINEAKQYFFDNIKEAMDILTDWAHGEEGCIKAIGSWFAKGDWQTLDEIVRRVVLGNIMFNIIKDLREKHGPRYFDSDANKELINKMDRFTKIVFDYFINNKDEYDYWFDAAMDCLNEYAFNEDEAKTQLESDILDYLWDRGGFELFDNDNNELPPFFRGLMKVAIENVDVSTIAEYFTKKARESY